MTPTQHTAAPQGTNPVWMCQTERKWGQRYWAEYPSDVALKLEAVFHAGHGNAVEWMWPSDDDEGEPKQKKARQDGIVYKVYIGKDFQQGCDGVQELTRDGSVTRRCVRRFLI